MVYHIYLYTDSKCIYDDIRVCAVWYVCTYIRLIEDFLGDATRNKQSFNG